MRSRAGIKLGLAAGALALASLVPQAASAQVCVGAPKALPHGLNGPPTWDPGDPTSTSSVVHWLNDARWANAAPRGFGDNRDDAQWRLVHANDTLLVSFRINYNMGERVLDGRNAVYFGIGDLGGGNAHVVKIALPDTGSGVPNHPTLVPDPSIQVFTWDPGASVWVASDPFDPLPGWLISPAAWVDEVALTSGSGSPSDSAWGVNFKLDLGVGGLGHGVGAAVKVALGADIVRGDTDMVVEKNFPNVLASAGGVPGAELIPADPLQWANTTVLGDACAGITVPRYSIGKQVTPGDYRTLSTYLERATGLQHRLVASPEMPDGSAPTDFSIAASFRMARWGSVFGEQGWTPLEDHTGADDFQVDDGHFDLLCPANTADGRTCGVSTVDLDSNGNRSHQCMLVEMRVANNSTAQIGVASQYRNMDFETASTVSRVATIDVRGIEALTGEAADRDIYLFVSRKNMPEPGSTELHLPRAEMFAKKFDVTGEYQCPDEYDGCADGICGWECKGGEFPCGNYKTTKTQDGRCFCVPWEQYDVCYPAPQSDPEDLDVDSGDDAALAEVWPQLQIWAYWDTGRTREIDGEVMKVMQPMYPFGMYVDHDGPYFGFTDRISGLNGVVVEQVAEDVYRLTVPNESSVELEVSVTALEEPHEVPLTEIEGAATRWGAFGTVSVVGMVETGALDFGKNTTITLESLLEENGTELVTNLSLPVTLEPLLSVPGVTKFANTDGPPVVMEVIEVPMLGHLTVTAASGVNIAKPAGCSGFFGQKGTTILGTAFTIDDGTHPPLPVAGEDEWSCRPFALVNEN